MFQTAGLFVYLMPLHTQHIDQKTLCQAMTTQNRSGAYQPQATALDNLLTRLYNGEGVSPDEIDAARRR